MYHAYDELMERLALLMAALSMPYVSDAERVAVTVEITHLQNEMELELVMILSDKCAAR